LDCKKKEYALIDLNDPALKPFDQVKFSGLLVIEDEKEEDVLGYLVDNRKENASKATKKVVTRSFS
jgi:hypothetical protein